jgi:hypothetical protein
MTSMIDTDDEVTLTLTGQRAQRGLALADLESFLDAFARALRDYDRAQRGEETRRAGHPERRAAAAAAFRLVRLQAGSAIVTLVADRVENTDHQLNLDDAPLALTTLAALVADVAAQHAISDDVLDDLDRARRSCGDDGAITLDLPPKIATARRVTIDHDLLERLKRPHAADRLTVTAISGRLYSVNLEPDRLAIRAPDGVEWACRYDADLEGSVRSLLGEVVWATGEGRLTAALRGTMRITSIQLAIHEQETELFVHDHPHPDELLTSQGVSTAQGLDRLDAQEWTGDEADERYLAAMFGYA